MTGGKKLEGYSVWSANRGYLVGRKYKFSSFFVKKKKNPFYSLLFFFLVTDIICYSFTLSS